MARKNQKLINYHTGKKAEMPKLNEVDYGEIVVRHNAESPELLIKISDDSFGVFQASGAVQTAINSAVSTAKTELNSAIDSVSSATKTLVSDVSAATKATYATKDELKSTSGSIISDYTTAIGNLASDLNGLSGVVSSITENYVTNSTLNTTVEALKGQISSAKTEAIGKASGYTDTQIAAAKKEIYDSATSFTTKEVNTLSGNVHTRIEGLKTDLTETINNKVAVAYRYQGTVTNYADLPKNLTSGETGYVYNVENANGHIPAGTNYAWNGTAWDALGGIVDLSPYAKTEDVNKSITNLDSKVGEFSSATVTEFASLKKYAGDTYATKTELKATSGSIITAYTTAISNAKKEATDASSAYTDTQVKAAKDSIKQTTDAISSNLSTLSGSVDSFSATVVNDYATKVIASGYAMTAEANAVASGKGYTDGQISAVITAYTEADKDLDARIDKLEAISAHTQSAVQNVVVANTVANKITATKTDENNVVTLNFDNMVIDCGDF